MSIVNGIRTISSLIGGSMTAAQLDAVLAVNSNRAGFLQALSSPQQARLLNESPSAVPQIAQSVLGIRTVLESGVAAPDFISLVGANANLRSLVSALRTTLIEFCRGPKLDVIRSSLTFPSRTMPSLAWTSVAYGDGIFVAVGTAAAQAATTVCATSPDGITWTAQSMPSGSWRSVVRANGVFVAVGGDGAEAYRTTCAVSADGVTWTLRSIGYNLVWKMAEVINGTLFAAGVYASDGLSNIILASQNNGITWSVVSVQTIVPKSIAYGNGTYVIVGSLANYGATTTVLTSTTGVSDWVARTGTLSNVYRSVAYGSGLFVAIGAAPGQVQTSNYMTSPDGINWTSRASLPNASWRDIVYVNGLFLAVASGNYNQAINTAAMSADGLVWTQVSLPGAMWLRSAFGDGVIVSVGSQSDYTVNVSSITSA